MAQFDVSTIADFENMTDEQKVNALLNADIPEPDMSKYISKDLFDKKVSELNNSNKKLKEQMNADQQKKIEEEEAKQAEAQKFADLESKYNELLKASTLKEHTISLSGLGFDEKLASETANAIVEGDAAKLFANLKKFLGNYEKEIEKKLMDKTPNPGGGSDGKEKEDAAITMAKKIAQTRMGNKRGFDDIMKNY